MSKEKKVCVNCHYFITPRIGEHTFYGCILGEIKLDNDLREHHVHVEKKCYRKGKRVDLSSISW